MSEDVTMEDSKLKTENQKLRNENVRLKQKLTEANTKLKKVSQKYEDVNSKWLAISKSLLGRLEILIWRIKGYIKRTIFKNFQKSKDISETIIEDMTTIELEEQPKSQKEAVDAPKQQEMGGSVEKLPEKKETEQKKPEKVIACQPEQAKKPLREKKAEQSKEQPVIMKDPVIMNQVYTVDWKEKYFDIRSYICDEQFLDKIMPMLDKIPESNGSRYFDRLKYKIGIIADEFIYHTYKDAADFIYLTPEDYRYEVDYILIVTAWRGVYGEWTGLGNPKNHAMREKLYTIIDYYKSKGKKIIYYSKEDPGNYYVFLDIAKQCDYIFTTAEECIEHYKKDTSVKNVNILEFAINPIFHNPVGMQKYHLGEVFFAGTWWNKKYPERLTDMETVFQSILAAGKELKLIDRNYSMGKPDYFYPEKYLKFVSPEIPHDLLQKVHKLYSWGININTSKSSTTMFASRVYEMQALGNLIISNHSVGMERLFPNIIVEDGSGAATKALMEYSDEQVYKCQTDGIRRIMTGETVYDRIRYLLKTVDNQEIELIRKAGIIIPDDASVQLREMAEKQTYSNKVILRRSELNINNYRQMDMITFMEEQCEYGENYLEDMINGFKYTDCDFITKNAYLSNKELIDGTEHDYVEGYSDKNRTVFWTESFELDELLTGGVNGKHRGYSIDHFNYKEEGTVWKDI